MSATTDTSAGTSAREFVISRDFAAPRALVFKAWTDPALIGHWWGPHGFTNPVCELDVRPGGAYYIVMRSPQGVDYPLKGVYREVIEPERLVFSDAWDEHPAEWHEMLKELYTGDGVPAGEALNTVTFAEHGGTTTLTIRSVFDSVAIRDAMVDMGMDDGWSQSLDRLEELLADA